MLEGDGIWLTLAEHVLEGVSLAIAQREAVGDTLRGAVA